MRWLKGGKSQANGSAFESAFEVICNQNGFSWMKLPNACRQIGKNHDGTPKLIRKNSAFDYIIARNGRGAAIDTKSTEGKFFSYSDIDQDQVKELWNLRPGMRTGYIVHYVALDAIVFYDVKQLMQVRPRESLKPADGLKLNSFGYICDLTLLKLDVP